jgi:hypothetical protein
LIRDLLSEGRTGILFPNKLLKTNIFIPEIMSHGKVKNYATNQISIICNRNLVLLDDLIKRVIQAWEHRISM